MHMSNALVNPEVGTAMLAVSAAAAVYSVKKISKTGKDDSIVRRMGIFGALVFAMQMVNFGIPGTGSSGHFCGGILLAVLLGPWAGFLTMGAVLAVQALLFADGGILAYGCNLFNLGLIPCFIVYPLVYRQIHPGTSSQGIGRIFSASMLASVIALQLGAFCVVIETWLSGVNELPFGQFAMLMQPIHLGIGIVEGAVTGAVILCISQSQSSPDLTPAGKYNAKTMFSIVLATFLIAGIASWFASSNPDGLEWAMASIAGAEELAAPQTALYQNMENFQQSTSLLPGYGFPDAPVTLPYVNGGTTVSGLLGSGLLILVAFAVSIVLGKRRRHFAEAS